MDENVIEKILEYDVETKKIFIGAFARDELPPRPPRTSCMIINTDPRDKPGSHWLAVYFNKNGYCDFFNSYGNPPSYFKLEKWVHENSNGWNWNKKRIQGDSLYCGYYCALYLIFKVRNREADFFSQWRSLEYNDNLIKSFIKKIG